MARRQSLSDTMSKPAAILGALALLLGLSLTGPAGADEQDEGGCVHERQIYPEGYEMCQSGQLVRCESGAWGDVGLCDDDTPPSPPRSEGGDRALEEDR